MAHLTYDKLVYCIEWHITNIFISVFHLIHRQFQLHTPKLMTNRGRNQRLWCNIEHSVITEKNEYFEHESELKMQ